MRSWKRLLFYLMINVVVSAVTTLAVFTLWERSQDRDQIVLPPQATIASPDSNGDSSIDIDNLHIVTYGDTLASIAQANGVSIEALMAANGLTDRSAIGIGQKLIIPQVEETNSGDAGTGGISEPIPEDNSINKLVIVSVVGAGDVETERVVMRNDGDGQVSLAGWHLQSEGGSEYVFPLLTLNKGGSVNVHTAAGQNSVVDLYWGSSQAIWEPGSQVILLDPQGREHVRFVVP